MQWCAADPGPFQLVTLYGPGSAAHRRKRVYARLFDALWRCAAPGTRNAPQSVGAFFVVLPARHPYASSAHIRPSEHPLFSINFWIPAFAGMSAVDRTPNEKSANRRRCTFSFSSTIALYPLQNECVAFHHAFTKQGE
jgi:hypothetical protein